jgi:hypothetical protein
MDRALGRLLRLSVASLLLSAAWNHFFWEAPYRAAVEAYPGVAAALRLPSSAGERLAFGGAVWFLLAGIVTVWWRPGWLARTVLILTLVPLTGCLAAEAALADPGWSRVTTRVWGVLATGVLAISGCGWVGAERFLLRAGLTCAFLTWAAVGLGWFGEVPEPWVGAVRGIWPGGRGSLFHVHLLAGLAMGACVCLWIRPLTLAGSILLALVGVAALLLPLGMRLDGAAYEWWHRWVPEAVGKLGLIVLPPAVWLVGERPRRLRTEPRRLRRVELPDQGA